MRIVWSADAKADLNVALMWLDELSPSAIFQTHASKRVAMKPASFALFLGLALSACGPPVGEPSHEIIETSEGVVGKLVSLKTSPGLKSGSLVDAGQAWQSSGWAKVNAERCKDAELPQEQSLEGYEIQIIGYAPDNIPTYNLRLCATQLTAPKRVGAIGFVVSTQKALLPKL
jgi:hypothetical protein